MYLIIMKKSSITNRRAKEFVNIVKNGTHEDLLNLYYKYKGFYKTGTADFVQQIVVDFMEEYCIAIKEKIKKQKQKNNKSIDLTQPTIEPSNLMKKQLRSFKQIPKRSLYNNKFGDDWNIDFEDPDDRPNVNHPSVICES